MSKQSSDLENRKEVSMFHCLNSRQSLLVIVAKKFVKEVKSLRTD